MMLNFGRKPLIAILGPTGMLGNMVAKYLNAQGYPLILAGRNVQKIIGIGKWTDNHEVVNLNVAKYTKDAADDIKNEAVSKKLAEADYIVNCIGAIKPVVDKSTDEEVRAINMAFPTVLAERTGKPFCQVSTDCIFSGATGGYLENDPPSATDRYGISKANGDINLADSSVNKNTVKTLILRTSIIGPEIYNKHSLLEWTIKNKGKKVDGWTNHMWNGITTLQWAKCLQTIIMKKLFEPGLRHLYSPGAVSKYELLQIIDKAFKLNLDINPVEAKEPCDRTLKTNYPKFYNQMAIPFLHKQINDLYLEY
jgi:dTDP-4-dehydrorhamnose reductase